MTAERTASAVNSGPPHPTVRLLLERPAALDDSPTSRDSADELAAEARLRRRRPAQRVVCAVDGAAVSRRAVREAAALARDLGSRLVLVHVTRPGPSLQSRSRRLDNRAAARAEQKALLVRLRHEFGPEFDPEVRVERGEPGGCLVDVASHRRAEFLVMGVPQRALWGTAFIGQVFRDLVRHSPCPVVAVPPHADQNRDHTATVSKENARESVVCGIDDTDTSRLAAKVATELASRLGLRPILVHAHQRVNTMSLKPISTAPGSLPAEQDERQAWGLLARRVEEHDAEGRFLLGHPAQALRLVAARQKGRLIVVGSRRLGLLRGMLFGSVSAQLASGATRPIVIVPQPHVHR